MFGVISYVHKAMLHHIKYFDFEDRFILYSIIFHSQAIEFIVLLNIFAMLFFTLNFMESHLMNLFLNPSSSTIP